MGAIVSLIASYPDRRLSAGAQAFQNGMAEQNRKHTYDETRFEEYTGSVMLQPLYRPDLFRCTKDRWVSNWQSQMVDTNSPFEEQGDYVFMNTGGPTFPWWAYYQGYPSGPKDTGFLLNLFWYRPSTTLTEPIFYIYTPVDSSRVKMITRDGVSISYRFCPLALCLRGNNQLVVYEYPYDDYTHFEEDPTTAFTEVHRHGFTTSTLFGQWLTFWVQAISARQILVRSPLLDQGGFVYTSQVDRDQIHLMNAGYPGLFSPVGGAAQFQMCPVVFPLDGNFRSEERHLPTVIAHTSDPDAFYPDFDFTYQGYRPTGATVVGTPLDPVTNADFTGDILFDRYKMQVLLTAAEYDSIGYGVSTPTVKTYQDAWDDDQEEVAPEPIELEQDLISIAPKGEFAQGGMSVDISVHNRGGQYDDLGRRLLTKFVMQINGDDYATFYGRPTAGPWFQSKQDTQSVLTWQGGDGYWLLNEFKLGKDVAYDGQNATEVIKQVLQRAGFTLDQIDIDYHTLVLPTNPIGEDYRWRPDPDESALSFILKIHDTFFSSWAIRFTTDGRFQMRDPLLVMTTVYFSLDNQTYPGIENLVVTPLVDEFYNEIAVEGRDPITQTEIVAHWCDTRSMTDPTYENYVGMRRYVRVPNWAWTTQAAVDRIMEMMKAVYGTVRCKISFLADMDFTARVGDFCEIVGFTGRYRIISMNPEVSAQTVSRNLVDTSIHKCGYECLSWPVTE